MMKTDAKPDERGEVSILLVQDSLNIITGALQQIPDCHGGHIEASISSGYSSKTRWEVKVWFSQHQTQIMTSADSLGEALSKIAHAIQGDLRNGN